LSLGPLLPATRKREPVPSATRTLAYEALPTRPPGEMLRGEPAEIAAKLVAVLDL